MPAPQSILAPQRGSFAQFALMTLPLFGVLLYFLYLAWGRPSLKTYNLPEYYTDDQLQSALEESGVMISLMDMMIVFLSLHVLWTIFAVYTISFIAKRRHLIGRYLAEGQVSIGDVIYDKSSRTCGGFHDYGYALYAHPTQRKLIRKRVRVYQPYTRERVAILRLPNRPLSGQSKVDLEIDLNAAAKDRDTSGKYIVTWALSWVVFTLLSAMFVLYQMKQIQDVRDDYSFAIKVFCVVVGLNVPFATAANWVRFLIYRNWMINRGAIIDDDKDARKVQGCIKLAESQDGSDVIPYSILNEEDMSYQGSIPSHSQSVPPNVPAGGDYVPPGGATQETDPNIQLGGDPVNGPRWVTL